jgi:hypothetical protein
VSNVCSNPPGNLNGNENGNGSEGGGGDAIAGTVESQALVVAARALAATDVLGLSDDAVVGVLDDLERAQRVVDGVRVDAGAELDYRAMTMSRFGHTAPVFMADRYGWPKGRAAGCVRTGRQLRRLPFTAPTGVRLPSQRHGRQRE